MTPMLYADMIIQIICFLVVAAIFFVSLVCNQQLICIDF